MQAQQKTTGTASPAYSAPGFQQSGCEYEANVAGFPSFCMVSWQFEASRAVDDAERTNPGTFPLVIPYRLGFMTPVGFTDFTTVNRNTALGSGILSNFGAIPYNNTSQGKLSESRFSAQNSRIGLRVDVNGATVLGYLEADFP